MKKLTTALEVAGVASITAGVGLIWLPAAFIVGGLGMIALSWGISRAGGRAS